MPLKLCAIGEPMIELAPVEGCLYRQGFAGDTFNTAWHMAQVLGPRARVGKPRKCFVQRHFRSRQKSRVDLNSARCTSSRHNRLSVNEFLPRFTTLACANVPV